MTHSINSVRAAIALAGIKSPSLAKRATDAVVDLQNEITALKAVVATQEAIINKVKEAGQKP